jgi:putative flippase GtrA
VTSLLRRGPFASRTAFTSWLAELARFGTVGAVAFVVDVGGYNLLVFGPWHPLASIPVRAGIVCWAVSVLVAWLGNRYWTFAAHRNAAKGLEATLFVLVNIAGLGFTSAALYVSRWMLHLDSALADNISRNVIGIGLGTIFRYFLYKFVVFRARPARTPSA